MAEKLAPRDKVGVSISVVDEDTMQTPDVGNPASVTDERSDTAQQKASKKQTPAKTFPQELNGTMPQTKQALTDEQVAAIDETQADATNSQIDYNANINAMLKDKETEYDEDTLRTDPVFQESARRLQEFFGDQLPVSTEGLFSGGPVSGGTQEEKLAEYGLDTYAEMVYNIGGPSMSQQRAGGTVPMLTKVLQEGDLDTMLATLYVMEMGDRKDFTLSGAGKALKHMTGDLSNYIGLATIPVLTAKTLAKKGTNEATKAALRKAIQAVIKKGGIKQSTVTAAKVGAVSGTEGGMLTGAENGLRQLIEIDAGVKDGFDKAEFVSNVLGGVAVGSLLGAGLVKIPDAVRAGVDAAETASEKAKELYKWIYDEYKQLEDDVTKLAGGGKPPEQTSAMDAAIESGDRKMVQATMRNASPEDRQKGIDFMQSQGKKAKAPKAKEQIVVQEEFNSQIYSRLEQAGTKIGKQDEFKGAEGVRNALLKLGVKPREIEASGVLNGFKDSDTVMGWMVHNNIEQRPDKITKRSLTRDSEEADESLLDRDDWEDYTSERIENSSESDSGEATVLTDEMSGQDVYIETRYDDDVYVDDSGYEYDYEEMQNDWYENHRSGDEWVDEGKAAAEMDGYDVWDELSPDEQKDYVIAGASDETPWGEIYGTKVKYEVHGNRYDDFDEAKDAALDDLYSYYEERVEYEGDSESPFFEDYYVMDGENKRMETYDMNNMEADEGKKLAEEPHLRDMARNGQGIDEYESVQAHARVQDWEDGTVVDELQSQWEQDWRREGANTSRPTPERKAELEKQLAPFKGRHDELQNDIRVLTTDMNNAKRYLGKMRREILGEEPQRSKLLEIDKLNDEVQDIDDKLISLRYKLAGRDGSKYLKESNDLLEAKTANVEKVRDLKKEIDDAVLADPTYKEVAEEHAAYVEEINAKRKERDEMIERDIRPLETELNAKPSDIMTPPMQNRPEYERVVLADQLLIAIKDGKKFFGWNNSGLQNGSRTPDSIREGMRNAYDIEMPRIIQKLTGKTPYKRYYEGGDSGMMWDGNTARTEAYDESEPWFWAVDLDEEVTSKLKDAKIDLYSVGGATVIGAGGADLLNEEETE